MKPQRVYSFLVVLLLMFPATIFCQQQMPLIAQKPPHTLQTFPIFRSQRVNNPGYITSQLTLKEKTGCSFYNTLPQIINPGFYTSHLGFFCRKELLFEKLTYIPLHFRLGSLEYVNRIEGKDKSALPGQ